MNTNTKSIAVAREPFSQEENQKLMGGYGLILYLAHPNKEFFQVIRFCESDFGERHEPHYDAGRMYYKMSECLQIVSEWQARNPGARYYYDGIEDRSAEGFLAYIQAHPDMPPAQNRRKGDEIGGTHYAQGVKTSPWDLQREMKTSGSVLVDVRRADVIKYVFRMKGDTGKLLEDLKKAKHCLEAGIAELENFIKSNPSKPE